MEKEVNNFHSKSVSQSLNELSSNPKGLQKHSAKSRLKKSGLNELPEKKKISPALIFLKQFKSALVYILIIAALISFFFDRLIDVYVISAILLINASIGFFQEYKAETAIQALKKMIVSYAKVYRNSTLLKINANELVPGDIIFLEEGDKVPADARLIDVKNLRTVEASLTGESVPADKDIALLPKKTALADRKNMVFMSTFVVSGQAKAVVTATGARTVIGTLAESIEHIKRKKSHFEKKTNLLAKQMGSIALIGATIVFLIGYFFRNFDFTEIFLFTIAELVSAIPEGLPAILTVVLAIGSRRMAKRKAIIRKLSATETLSVVDVICTDKTGTLTKNTMTIQKIILPGKSEIEVSGVGWTPKGEFSQNKKRIVPLENPSFLKLINISALCNNARIYKEENRDKIIGDPTEAALVVLAEKAGVKKEVLQEKEKKIDDLPFNQSLKLRASLVKTGKKKQLYVIGAPESILSRSARFQGKTSAEKINPGQRQEIYAQIDKLSSDAMRVLAIAYKDLPANTNKLSQSDIKDLVHVGLVGMIDPPREGVKKAIARSKKAGIRVIMTTGDHKNTAIAIAKQIGLIDTGQKTKYSHALTETELRDLSEEYFEKVVKEVSVFARLSPKMKLKIASTLQKQGHVVAMTGDGVNDAPALKKADIGISMGVIGTDVAREASEIVLADDNFASIINAIEEGRIVFINTKQASFLLISTNFAETATIIATLIAGLPLPLLPIQILWLNLVTDSFPGIALATEPDNNHVIQGKPRKPKENILSREILPFLILVLGVMFILTLTIFSSYLPQGLEKARTGAFVTMSLTQIFNMYNMRSIKNSVFKIGFFSNKYATGALIISITLLLTVVYTPFIQNIFQFKPLTFFEFALIAALSSLVLWFGEAYKFIRNSGK